MSTFTPIDDISKIRDAVKAGFSTGKTLDINYRKEQLLRLAYLLQDNETRFQQALKADLGRPQFEANFLEITQVITEAMTAYSKVKSWAKPDSVPFDWKMFALQGKILKQPQGVVLIIGPFNYPLWCLLIPFVGAIAAGCAVVLKPSELATHTEALIAELIPKYMDPDLYRVVTAEVKGTTKLLELQWDHIMYTGNGTVGKIVATAAAKHLTPVSLELGGKSPVLVDKTADLRLTARRVLWGKMLNAGQTCVAPDYILVTDGRQDALVEEFKKVYAEFYPEGGEKSESFSRIVADRHFDRLKNLLDNTKGEVFLGGQTDAATRFIAPTVVKNVTPEDSLMEQEIFGPILPIVAVKDLEAAIAFINERDRPLALYPFTSKNKNEIWKRTQSGMTMHNDCIISAGVEGLPFGGTGPSGYGSHKFQAGFDAFTHRRSSISSPWFIDLFLFWRFPPYTARNASLSKMLLQPKVSHARPAGLPQKPTASAAHTNGASTEKA